MPNGPELRTGRLLLRRWQESDLEPFAALNGDPEVMEHFPSVMDDVDTAQMIERIEAHFDEHGFGLWALESTLTGTLAGFAGLSVPGFEALHARRRSWVEACSR